MGTEFALIDYTAKEYLWLGTEDYTAETNLYQIDDMRIVHFIKTRHGNDLKMVNEQYPGKWIKEFKRVDGYENNGGFTPYQIKEQDKDADPRYLISLKLADKIHIINRAVNNIGNDEWAILDELIKNIDDELVQIESFQSMFNPVAAGHKADNRRQAQRRLVMLKEWKELIDLAFRSGHSANQAHHDLARLSGIID